LTSKSRDTEPPQPPEAVIYVVDDDISVRESLGNLMRSVGLKVELFASAVEFRRHPRPPGPSCLVLDVRLPSISGLDLQSEMVALGDTTPIVFITGHGDVPMSVRAMKAGALEFLQKPFREQDLLDAIHTALNKSVLPAATSLPHPGSAAALITAAPLPTGLPPPGVAMTSPRQALARNIHLGRTIFGWSQEELGSRCELHRSHISALEREELSVGVDAIDRIALAFEVPPHVLLMPPAEAQAMLLRAFNGVETKPRRTPRPGKR
jgi:ActR/RegA family two-component response regulator